MKFWLVAFLFSPEGEFLAKDIYEIESYEQCETMASNYAKVHINSKMMVQLHCVSDDHYSGRKQDEGVDYD